MGLVDEVKKIFAEPVDPRKISRDSNLESKGTVPTDAKAMKEAGSSRPLRLPDIVPQFSNRLQMLRAFKEMEDGDTTVDVSMRAINTPIMGATFFMQPFDDKPINVDINEFCDFNIFHGTARPFILTLADICRMFPDGSSILEHVFETREWAPKRSGANRKKYTMLQKLAPRPALTIKDLVYDDSGGPVSILQNAIRADGTVDEVEIKVEKLLIFTVGGIGGDLLGKPLLRTAYQPWYFKKELYKIDAIGHERNHLGVPVWTLTEGFTQADIDAAWALVTQMRTNEKSGVVEPPGSVFRFEKPEGQPSDIMPSIEHHDSHILLNVLAQFLMLGLTGGGGRATSGAHVDMFQKSVRYFGYNFDTDEFPQMRVRNIGETKDLQMWASSHARMIHEGVFTLDTDTENFYRENMDMPYLLGERPEPVEEEGANPKKNGKVKGGVSNAGTTGDTSVPPGFESAGG